MPNPITYIPFGELLKNVVDNRGRTCPTANSGIPLIATNCIKIENLYPVFEKVRYVSEDVFKNWFRGHPEPGDIIFVNKGSPGRVCWVPNPLNFCIAQDMVAIRADEKKVYPKYLFAALRSENIQGEIENLHVGSLIPHFKKGDFNDLKIPIPDKVTQKYIGDFYFTFSLKIDLLIRQNESLEQLAETLFRQWIIEEAADSWEEKGLDEIAEFLNGLACQKFPVKAGEIGLPVIKIKELRTGITDNTDIATNDVPEKYLVQNGDMLFSWSGSLDILIWSGGIGVLNQHLFKVSSNDFPQWFYYFWVKYHLPDFQGIAEDKATTMGHIQRHHLSDAKVFVPPKDKLNKINETINPIFEKFKRNQIQIRSLANLRDMLLPKLMDGEVPIIE